MRRSSTRAWRRSATRCETPRSGRSGSGGSRPTRFEHVFASIQSLNAADLAALPADHFDVVIVDEFHHAAATSYTRVLDHLEPVELSASPPLPSAATACRSSTGSTTASPPSCACGTPSTSSTSLRSSTSGSTTVWTCARSRGVGAGATTSTRSAAPTPAPTPGLASSSSRWPSTPSRRRCAASGSASSIEHARFMADHFNRHGIDAVAVWGDSPQDERQAALRDLAEGRVRAVFSVDLFNEGVDVPAVDTVLMLRPTESPTLFLQQLGRGLRQANGQAVLHGPRLRRNAPPGVPLRPPVPRTARWHSPRRRAGRAAAVPVPPGRLQHAARPEGRRDRAPKLAGGNPDALAGQGRGASLAPTGCAGPRPRRVPRRVGTRPRRRLRRRQELVGSPRGGGRGRPPSRRARDRPPPGRRPAAPHRRRGANPHLPAPPRRVGIASHRHADRRGNAASLTCSSPRWPTGRSARTRRFRRPSTSCGSIRKCALSCSSCSASSTSESTTSTVCSPRTPTLRCRSTPATAESRSSRRWVSAAGRRIAAWQSGVYEARDANAELLAFTLDKSSGGFSPTTRYRDYAISRTLIHWESQSITRADSPTGLRYRNHERDGRAILLFTRLRSDDRSFWFLGPATYQSHVGEKPMAITWKLDEPLPGDLYAAFAAAVA